MFRLISTVQVKTWSRCYPVYIGFNLLDFLDVFLSRHGLKGKFALVSHKSLMDIYGDKIISSISRIGSDTIIIDIPEGEESKSFNMLTQIYDVLINNRFDRWSTITAFGGGVIGDLAGFAAATFMRGINLVQIPSTLLAQVDSSIGGKVAIDYRGKNIIGAFYQPNLVITDLNLLKSLSVKEFSSGLAEVIKYGVVMDPQILDILENYSNPLPDDVVAELITRSCSCKARIVEADERDEKDIRIILNFGHTIGHAIEAASNFKISHGEAVAIGMVYEAKLSVMLGFLDVDVVDRLVGILSKFGLPVSASQLSSERILSSLSYDKKIKHGKIRLILLKSIGNPIVHDDVPIDSIRRVLEM